MDSFIYSLNATIPIFAIMIAGYFFRQIGVIDDHFASVANKFVFKVCLPFLVFQDLADTDIRHNFDAPYIGFCVSATLSSILVIWFLAKKLMKRPSEVGAFVQGAYRSSAAILGIAFIQNIYGNSGMAPLMIIGSVPLYNIFAVVILTFEGAGHDTPAETLPHGRPAKSQFSKTLKTALVNILKNPIIIGIALGLAASFLNLGLPDIADKTIHNLAVMASPLALLSIGASFEGKKAITKIKPTAIASICKLILLTAIFMPIAIWVGFRDQKLIAILIMLASPTTPTSYIMAKNMGGDDILASSIVVTTTLFSSITLTAWIFLLRFLGLIQ